MLIYRLCPECCVSAEAPTWMSVRPYSTESISCTTRSVVASSDCSTSGRAVPLSDPLQAWSAQFNALRRPPVCFSTGAYVYDALPGGTSCKVLLQDARRRIRWQGAMQGTWGL